MSLTEKAMSSLAQQLIAVNKATKDLFLDLGNCKLTELPDELFDCVWLEHFNFGVVYYNEQEQAWQSSQNKDEQNQVQTLRKNSKSIA